MLLAELDAIEDFVIEEGLSEADQHHVFCATAAFDDQALEDLVAHVLFGLLVCLAGTHRAVDIALGRGLDDVLYRQGIEPRRTTQITPQQASAVPGTHLVPNYTALREIAGLERTGTDTFALE